MYALEAKTPSAQRGLRTEQSPLRVICLHSMKWADQIGSNGSINNYHFTDELVLTEGEIVQYFSSTTIGSFQQNFGVFTNLNNVFYDLLLSYFMPGFEQSSKLLRENSAVKNSYTAVSPTRFKL